MFFLRKTLLKPYQIHSLLCITSRFLSIHISKSPKSSIPDIPTSASYDELIATAGRAGDLTTLHHLFNKRYKDGCFNTSNTFKFLTENNLNVNLYDLLQTLSNLDKGFGRKNAFDNLISHLCKSNQIDESLRVIETMMIGNENIGINSVTFHPLLNTLTKKKRYNEAWLILAKMKDNGISIDVTCYNFFLMSYSFNGDLTAAVEVVKKILEEGLKEDSRTYDAMVLGACRVGKVEGALKLLRRMEEERVPPHFSTHAHVIRTLLGLGFFVQAVEFVMAFGGRDDRLDTESFGVLGNSLIRKRRFEEAKFVLGEMDKRGLVMGHKLRKEYMELLKAD